MQFEIPNEIQASLKARKIVLSDDVIIRDGNATLSSFKFEGLDFAVDANGIPDVSKACAVFSAQTKVKPERKARKPKAGSQSAKR